MNEASVTEQWTRAILELATSAARNTRSTVVEVLKRHKSRAYILGQLQKQFPDAPQEDLRALITSTRWESLESATAHSVVEKPRRPPARGREPIDSPKWDERIRQLMLVLNGPLETEELKLRAKRELRWTDAFFFQVLATAEARRAAYYGHPFWMQLEGHALAEAS